ncbi:DUF6404 family protein [Rhodoferax sp.]|jgi:hypothetical protein|uniref:DUF6404 family protein n=1 Tax=Rhodoferax sp. TaxID=50421 RepID=UPI0037842AE1
MSFDLKRTQALEIMARTGIWRSNYEPPAFRMLWRMGIRIPPPHFIPFFPIAFGTGLTFAVLWGVPWGILMWLFVWSQTDFELQRVFIASGQAGLFFGVSTALYYAYGRYKYKLPNWNSLGDDASV